MKQVIVLGGGIVGLSSAYYLREAGHAVTVLDKDGFSDNCSYGNLGYICPSHFIPLAAPGIVWQGIKWMFDSQSPFYVRPSFNAALIEWGLAFIRSATQGNVDRAARPLKDIAVFSREKYREWERIGGFDMAFEQNGMLEIFRTEKAAHHAAHTTDVAKGLGLDVELLDKEQLRRLEPQTRIDALGAIFFKCDAHLYPDKLMASLKRILPERGVRFIAAEASGFECKRFANGRQGIARVVCRDLAIDADELVIATGSWSRRLIAQLGTKIPMMPGRGYSFTLDQPSDRLNHPAILTEGRVAITPFENGSKMRFGGTMEVVGIRSPPRYHRVEGIVRAVKQFLPEFRIDLPPIEKIWYGYRPTSADGLPFIGKLKRFPNVTVATGHAMLGLSLGAGTGKLVAELIDEEKPSVDLAPFAVERFE